jgi:hypothetical protein
MFIYANTTICQPTTAVEVVVMEKMAAQALRNCKRIDPVALFSGVFEGTWTPRSVEARPFRLPEDIKTVGREQLNSTPKPYVKISRSAFLTFINHFVVGECFIFVCGLFLRCRYLFGQATCHS